MAGVKVREATDKDSWDGRVSSVPEGTVYQTTQWARYMERREKAKPVFLIAQDEDGSVLGSLLFFRLRSFRRFSKFGILANIMFKIIDKFMPIISWNYGPLVYDKSRFEEISASLLKEAIKKGMGLCGVFLKDIIVPMHGDPVYKERAERIFNGLHFKEKRFTTILIDLQKSDDELWGSLKNSARKAIKKSGSINLDVTAMTRGDLGKYHHLLSESRKRVRIELPPNYPNPEMWDELADVKNMLRVFSVNNDGMLLGAIGILDFNGIVFEIGPALSGYSFENKIYASDMLKWHIIKNGKASGNKVYDLCGLFVDPRTDRERSLNQFKEKWGGERIFYNHYYKFILRGYL